MTDREITRTVGKQRLNPIHKIASWIAVCILACNPMVGFGEDDDGGVLDCENVGVELPTCFCYKNTAPTCLPAGTLYIAATFTYGGQQIVDSAGCPDANGFHRNKITWGSCSIQQVDCAGGGESGLDGWDNNGLDTCTVASVQTIYWDWDGDGDCDPNTSAGPQQKGECCKFTASGDSCQGDTGP